MTKDDLRGALERPRKLEALYRDNPGEFSRIFPEIYASSPSSPLLDAWQERLFFAPEVPETNEAASEPTDTTRAMFITIALSLLAGTLIKLPQFFPAIDNELFYPRNTAFIIILSIAASFLLTNQGNRSVKWQVIIPACCGLMFLYALPKSSLSQTVIQSYLHMPFFFWSTLGVAFMGIEWSNYRRRMDYLRFNGELVIYTSLVLLGGIVLTGITMGLFELINAGIQQWYMSNVVVYGLVASPVVATLLIDQFTGRRVRIAPVLARIFAPLFLITVVVYLVASIVMHKSPYEDREFLITFNGLLLVVLGLSVLVIAERKQQNKTSFSDIVNIGLVAVTLVIDGIALSAILFRLSTYGFSPNRIVVLGANIIAFIHLPGILYFYIRAISGKSGFLDIEKWIARYLPVYTSWSFGVAVLLPLIYWFK